MRPFIVCLIALVTSCTLADPVELTITREPLVQGTISPMQDGQFIEYLCDLVPSMWAEKLYDNSFEGLTPYDFVYLKETDFKEKPWYPCAATNRATFERDKTQKISGDVSMKIAAEDGAAATVGISQDGLYVDRGAKHTFRCYLRAERLGSPVTISIHQDGKVLASREFMPTESWQKYSATIEAAEAAQNATISIHFRGPGTLWIDNASLMPAQTVGGWRPDVVKALRELKPGVIRFGGSTVEYPNFEWTSLIGDADHRKSFRAWGGLQNPAAGIEEIVQLIQAVDAEPLMCVRFNGKSPKDAADEVEYFNGASSTKMGALREKNGHREPYKIKYWQVGNEVTSPEYDSKLADFCKAMKAVDPQIKVLSSFPTPNSIKNAAQFLDYVAPHHYSADLNWMSRNFGEIRELLKQHAPGKSIHVAVTEWNTTAGDAGPRRAMLWTLSNALAVARYHNLMHRNCDLVEIANRSNLTNSFCSGIIQCNRSTLYKTPTYYAQQLYSNLAGTVPLKIDGKADGLDASATLSEDGKTVTLFVVNDSANDLPAQLNLPELFKAGAAMNSWTLCDRDNAGEPDVTNTFEKPERVAVRFSAVGEQAQRMRQIFARYSLTALQWQIK
jgi:alpha-N-arabinofuranosidase